MELVAIVEHYGPLAFGLVVAITCWVVVVRPQLAETRAITGTIAAAANAASAAAASARNATADALKAAEVSRATAESCRAVLEAANSTLSRAVEIRKGAADAA